ncbi:MAG: pyridoxamine kinase [Clostridia bacterium]|nr:pyridoxamine kinase [Clostridia bacterium]
MKRIITVQDISCVGRCSLTAALPVISALGVECAVLPTAVLSNHTAFSGFTFHDLTGELSPIMAEWKRQKFRFDALYSGYLGSKEQIALVSALIDDIRAENPSAHIIIDPAMADFGKLYTGFDDSFARAMTGLCAKADIILPNLTEASCMLGIPYKEQHTEAELHDILRRLSALGSPQTVLTGVSLHEGKLGAMVYDRERDSFYTYENDRVERQFHGTGDLFSSVVTGALVRGMTLEDSVKLAVDFVLAALRATMEDPDAHWYGVNFEAVLGMLCHASHDLHETHRYIAEGGSSLA